MTSDDEKTILHWGLVLVALANIILISILIYLRLFQRRKKQHLSTHVDHQSVDGTEIVCDEDSEQSIQE
jgi:uncharacterized membrane protein affecting hemolysin expression